MISIASCKSRCVIGCLLGIGLLLLGFSNAWGQQITESAALDVILLIENSSRVSQLDPEGSRIQAAKFLVDYLRAYAQTSKESYRVGVVSFGGVVGDVITLRSLQDDVVREGIHAERITSIDFHPPLQFALRELRAKSFGTGSQTAIILLTSGRPQSTETPLSERELQIYFEEQVAPLVRDLQEEGASFFVVSAGGASQDRMYWTSLISPDHYIPVIDMTNLCDIYHRIANELVGITGSESVTLPPDGTSLEMESYLGQAILSFISNDPASIIILTSPSEIVFTPTIATSQHTIYNISLPDAGEWKVSQSGEGEVKYWIDRQWPHIRVAPQYRVGRPMTITASLVRDSMTVTQPLDIEVSITPPSGEVVMRTLSYAGGGRYIGSYEGVRVKGVYTITARAFLNGQLLRTHSSPAAIRVLALAPTATPRPTLTSASTALPKVASPTPTAASPSLPDRTRLIETGLFAALVLVSYSAGRYFLARREEQMLKGSPDIDGRKPPSLLGRYFRLIFAEGVKDTLDELKSAHTREQIEEIVGPVEQVMKTGRGKAHAPSIFALKILRLYAIGETSYAIEELTRYGKSGVDVKEVAASIAVFNFLIREDMQDILPMLYHLISSGCDRNILQRAQYADIIDVPGLKEANPMQQRDVRQVCRLYSDLLGRGASRLLTQTTRIEKMFERYEAVELLALHKCITRSQECIKEWAFVPVDVPSQLRAASFDSFPSLHILKDILVQFKDVELYPLQTDDRSGFLDVVQAALQRLVELEEERICPPEYRMATYLFESWRHFAEDILKEGARAKLIAKPITTNWLPTNVRPEDVCIAWVFHNEGPSFAKLHRITFSWEGQELARDAEEIILRPDERRVVTFNLDKLENPCTPPQLDLTILISLSDGRGSRMEHINHTYHGFEVMTSFRGSDVFGKEIVELLQSNRSLPSDAVRKYCSEAQLHVHCNQFALVQLLDHGGRNPLLVHILLYGLIRYLSDEMVWKAEQPRYITCADVSQVIDYLVNWDLMAPSGLIIRAWRSFPPDERAALKALIKSSQHHAVNSAGLDEIQAHLGAASALIPLLERLEARGLIEKLDDEQYRLQAKLLEKWFQACQEHRPDSV